MMHYPQLFNSDFMPQGISFLGERHVLWLQAAMAAGLACGES